MTNETGFNSLLGGWSERVEHRVEADEAAFCAEATGDPIPAHRSGRIAPPIYATLATGRLTVEAFAALPAELMAAPVHFSYSIDISQPLVPRMRLLSRARSTGLRAYPGGSSIEVSLETTTRTDEPVNRQRIRAEFPSGNGASAGSDVEVPVQPAGMPEVVTQHIDEEQAAGFGTVVNSLIDQARGAATFELSWLLRRVLAVGAMTSAAVINELGDSDPARLRSFELSGPAHADCRHFVTRIWRTATPDSSIRCTFDSITTGGAVVVDRGSATFVK